MRILRSPPHLRVRASESPPPEQTPPDHVWVRDTIIKPLFATTSDGTPPLLCLDYTWHEPVCPIDYKGFLLIGAAFGFLAGSVFAKLR